MSIVLRFGIFASVKIKIRVVIRVRILILTLILPVDELPLVTF